MENSPNSDQVRRVAVIIGSGVLGSMMFLVGVVELWPYIFPEFAGSLQNSVLATVRVGFGIFAVATALLIPVIRSRLLPARSISGPAHGEDHSGSARARKWLTASIVSLAIPENIGFLGFVLFVLGGERMDFYLFAIPAIGLMVFFFPRPGARIV